MKIEISYWIDCTDSRVEVQQDNQLIFDCDDVSGIIVWDLENLLRKLGHTVHLISLSDDPWWPGMENE